MPACRAKISPLTPRSSWENCPSDKKYYRQYKWNKDQVYEGEFFRDSLHGDGTYKWMHMGVYEGGFYSNYKEGYAVLSFPDNSCFEGLFVGNQRFGPGIFTYSNGRQDAGFWVGKKLVRLSRSVDCIIPRLAPTSAAKIKLLQFRRLIPVDEEVDSCSENYHMCDGPYNYLSCPYSSLIFDPRSYFFDKVTFERTYILNSKHTSEALPDDYQNWDVTNQEEEEEEEEDDEEDEGKLTSEYSSVPSHCLCPTKEFKMKYRQQSFTDICEKEDTKNSVEMGLLAYFTHYGMLQGLENKDEEESVGLEETEEVEENVKQPKILAWNRNELCTLMLKQIFRYRELEGKLTFNIAKLMIGGRTSFRRTGEKEKQCLEFLKTCAVGLPQTVKTMLCEYDLSEELTDARGNNSVMFAAATDQHEIIDILLNYGVDVNSFNDESLTPLNLCLLRRLAQTHDLGNWETVFLPREVEKTEDGISEAEEWRKQTSIPSLDRIFGDGMSLHEAKELQSGTFSQESFETKSKSLMVSDLSSASALLMLSKSFINAARDSLVRKSMSPAPPTVLSSVKTKPKTQSIIVKTEEFEKSVRPSSKDSYFFQLVPQTSSESEAKRKGNSRQFRRMSKELEGEEISGEGYSYNSEKRKKLLEIDKTIEKLLKRGADPNLSEVPKPSIHLGVYTKDWKVVHLLLSYGANPNIRLYSNEGLLTPLHVLVLLKSDLHYVGICDILLNFGADPEEETHPTFAFYEEEKPFLDFLEGRTPLQLLCMRPDLEYADPEGYLIKIALMLARACNKTRFYKGYSYLALAMWFGNLKLLKALLDSKYFDPNVLLGNDMGTILHILVSTEFQKKTEFDTSIKICDYLLDAKANPLKRINHPEILFGNCIDYGYREVDAEKALRKLLGTDTKENGKKESGKKSSKKMEKPEKPLERDHLTDHINVLEYLGERMEEMKRKKKQDKATDKDKNLREKNISNKSITQIKPRKGGKWNESETNMEDLLEFATEAENRNDGKRNEGKDLKKGESELRKDFGQDYDEDDDGDYDDDDDDNDDDEAKRKAKEFKVGGKGKKQKGGGKNLKFKKLHKGKKGKQKKKTGLDQSKLKLKSSLSKSASQKQPFASETFPEKLRRSILKLIGNCASLDINELLLPYVVLRDGDLYYNVKAKGSWGKEQYSLI